MFIEDKYFIQFEIKKIELFMMLLNFLVYFLVKTNDSGIYEIIYIRTFYMINIYTCMLFMGKN